MPGYPNLEPSREFLRSLFDGRFSRAEQEQLLKALQLLDENERHPSLRIHQLKGPLAGVWSASASASLRITFERLPDGRKRLVEASRHYGD